MGSGVLYTANSPTNGPHFQIATSDGFFEEYKAFQPAIKQMLLQEKVVDCQLHKAINCCEQTIKPLTACFARRCPQIKENKQKFFFFFLPLFLSISWL